MEPYAKLISAIAELAWPCVVLFVFWKLGSAFKDFLSNASEGTVKGFGFEASAKRVATAADAIVTAEVKALAKPEAQIPHIQLAAGVGKSRRLADFVAESVSFSQLNGRSILWVDDQPENNESERLALTSLGLNIDTAKSTTEALKQIASAPYDVIISDMQRVEGPHAGYDLLAKLKKMKSDIPFIIYRSSHSSELEDEAFKKGAFGTTNEAVDLIILVANALRSTGKIDLGVNYSRRLRELRNFVVHGLKP